MLQIVNQKVARTYLDDHRVWFRAGHFLMAFFALAVSGLLFFAGQVNAQETLCAEVTIQIQQELTLERQAFDAHMRINNGVDGFPVENVNIDVKFTDENGDPVEATSNPQNTTASFFIQVDQLSGIGDITGTGAVPPASSADINWLIIPAPGSGSAESTGKLYFVGATLSYTLNGENKVTEITPDFIYVKPMPLLSLDYFLPTDVYADDPLTTPIEPIVPFTLGVRVNNQGQATARKLKIDSSQPEIIDNQLGLLIDFRITSSFVDDQPVNPTLLLDFGDIPAGSAKMGRWQMETTLSGQFTSFTVEFSHSDELGGQLTSLLDTVVTHELVRDVLVDLPGRDGVNDFLAKEAVGFKVYESNGVDTMVVDQSSSASMTLSNTQGEQSTYTLTTSPTSGFLYMQLSDPHSENKGIVRVTRSDGKELDPSNFWLSKIRNGASSWNYFVNFFDQNSTGSYTVVMESLVTNPQPPVMQFIPDRQVVAGNQVSFIVEASDPNNTLPTISATPLPTGASFFPDPLGPAGISTYIFDWTPTTGQVGDYNIEYTASDGQLQTSQTALIKVCAVGDTDCDRMDDAWEILHFGDLSRDGFGDFDNDGFLDLIEFIVGMDPTIVDLLDPPQVNLPADGEHVNSQQPLLSVVNSVHTPGANTVYSFEVFDDPGMSNQITQVWVAEGSTTTDWQVDTVLNDNQKYYWRAKACYAIGCSYWVNSTFFVNLANDLPGSFHLSSPGDATEVQTTTPVLEITNSQDADEDPVAYLFMIHEDTAGGPIVLFSNFVFPGENGTTSLQVPTALNANKTYFWRAIAADQHGAYSISQETWSFSINSANTPPGIPGIVSPEIDAQVTSGNLDIEIGNSVDPDSASLNYLFELDTVNTFDSPSKQVSGSIPEGGQGTTSWSVSGLVENEEYFWRAKADDGLAQSGWVNGKFLMNATNESPSIPVVKNPGDATWVSEIRPTLELHPSRDPEGDAIKYLFEVYQDSSLSSLIVSGESPEPRWVIPNDLTNNARFSWRAHAEDSLGAMSLWGDISSFFVVDDGVDDPPTISLIEPAQKVSLTSGTVRIEWEDDDPDSNAEISLFYFDANTPGAAINLIAGQIQEDPDGNQDVYLWDITGVVPGDYIVFGLIWDGNQFAFNHAPGLVTIGASQGSVSVNAPDKITTSETGVSTEVKVALNSAPSSNVTIPVNTSDSDEGYVTPRSLVFTPENWHVSQTLKITGVDDCASDGEVEYNLVFSPAVSEDPAYNGVAPADLLVTNRDNDPLEQNSPSLRICNYTQVEKLFLEEEATFEYTFQAELTNSGDDKANITATLEEASEGMEVIDGNVTFENLSSGTTLLSTDTFTIRVNKDSVPDLSELGWSFE